MDTNTTKKILVPVDFCHTSDLALNYATSLAKEKGAGLLIVHVQEIPRAYGGDMYYGIPEPSIEELESMLNDIEPPDRTIPVEHRLVSGDPAFELVRVAEEEKVELIVVGSHGRTGLARALLGSVAEAIVRKAHCPVLVCKPRHSAAA